MPNLGDIREEVDVLRAEVCYVTKSHMLAISPVVPLFVQLISSPGPRYFNIFMKNNESVSIVGTNRSREGPALYQ